jgi:hypothetical protein
MTMEGGVWLQGRGLDGVSPHQQKGKEKGARQSKIPGTNALYPEAKGSVLTRWRLIP